MLGHQVIAADCRVSRFRGLPRSATAPMLNCLDFGWRSRPAFKKAVRWRGPAVTGDSPLPGAAGGFKLIAAANHDLAAVFLP